MRLVNPSGGSFPSVYLPVTAWLLLPRATIQVMSDNEHDAFVHVYDAPGIPEGQIAKARLESEGIPVMTKGEGGEPFHMAGLELWVRESQAAKARELVEEMEAGDFALDEGSEQEGEPSA